MSFFKIFPMFAVQTRYAMLESAAKFVFDLILENEEVKKFPRDFVTASMKWVRSWFLTDDDPQTAAVLQAPQSSAAPGSFFFPPSQPAPGYNNPEGGGSRTAAWTPSAGSASNGSF